MCYNTLIHCCSVYQHISPHSVQGWTSKMRIANAQLLFPYRPIQSVSEFGAIAGGEANHMLQNLGPITWAAMMMMYAGHMQYTEGLFKWDIVEVFVVIGVSGIVIIGMFDLNQFDYGLIAGHYLGVFMSIFILVGGIIHGVSLSESDAVPGGYSHFVFPVVMTVIAVPCFLRWQWITRPSQSDKFEKRLIDSLRQEKCSETGENEEAIFRAAVKRGPTPCHINPDPKLDVKLSKFEDILEKSRKEINRLSFKALILEGLSIYCVVLTLSWHFYNWGSTCSHGCAYT